MNLEYGIQISSRIYIKVKTAGFLLTVNAKDYIAAVQVHSKERSGEGEVDLWAAWASEQIDRIESSLLSINHESTLPN